jgi:hypothetical protein
MEAPATEDGRETTARAEAAAPEPPAAATPGLAPGTGPAGAPGSAPGAVRAVNGRDDGLQPQADTPAVTDTIGGREALAGMIAGELRQFSGTGTATSFLIHIDGPWGSGKTSLLAMIAQQLRQKGTGRPAAYGTEPWDSRPWLVVNVNAWREAGVGAAWWVLMSALRRALSADRRLPAKITLRCSESVIRSYRAGARYYLAALILLALSAAVFGWLSPGHLTAAGEASLAQDVTATLAAVSVLAAGALAAGRFLFWDSARGARLYEQSKADPMEEIADHFRWLLGRARRPVVYFIDDLDRCEAPFVVALLEAAQTLVRDAPLRGGTRGKPAAGVSFVVAADRAWLRESYQIAYRDLSDAVAEPGRPLGYLFVDKLFQVRVPMPSVDATAMRAYLSSLLRPGGAPPPPSDDLAAGTTRRLSAAIAASTSEADIMRLLEHASPEQRHALAGIAIAKLSEPRTSRDTKYELQQFWRLLGHNPRAVKLFLNNYLFRRAVLLAEGIVPSAETLALWAIVETRWPALADDLRVHPEHAKLVGAHDARLYRAPAALRELFSDDAVRAVFAFGDGTALTPERIRACCGTGF